MSTNRTLSTRVTALESNVTELRSDVKTILALLQGEAPAKPATAPKAPARKAPARKAAAKKAPAVKAPLKGAQTRETLSRKDWNRTLTTLAKTQPKGSGAYAKVIAGWEGISAMRDGGFSPAEALETALTW